MSETNEQKPTVPDFIKVVRMLRSVRGLDYRPAKDEALRLFAERGWQLPRFMDPK